jgi:putative ABC transport system substrate-binding protein
MRRREFIGLLGGAAAALPLAARAQQPEQMRRIGILMNRAADDPEGQARVGTFRQALEQLGWSEGRNVRIDIRWGEDIVERERKYAAELVTLAPDVILAGGTLSVAALQHVTRTVPIVFAGVGDPVGAGFVESLARPGGNTTGFMVYEYGLGAKWLELLKQLAPNVTRVAVLRDPDNSASVGTFGAVQAAAQSLRVEVNPVNVRDADEIKRGVAAFARAPNGGLVVIPSASVSRHRNLIITLAVQHKLPAVYPFRYMATGGGLMSYAPDWVAQYRPAADYVDRILKGENPSNLPVQVPTKYQMVINLKAAKTLGFTVPQSLLASADEVIE